MRTADNERRNVDHALSEVSLVLAGRLCPMVINVSSCVHVCMSSFSFVPYAIPDLIEHVRLVSQYL
jgi:hypothetical protein